MVDSSSSEKPTDWNDENSVRSIGNAIRVLQGFSRERPTLTISQAAVVAGISRGTARRVLMTLERLGLLRLDGRDYIPTPKLLGVGYSYLSALPFWDLAQPYIRKLNGDLNESCNIAVLDDLDVVYVARLPARRALSSNLTVGSRLPAYATSLGRVLLAGLSERELAKYLESVELLPLTERTITDPDKLRAELDNVRRAGYAIVDGEREMGVRSTAAPITDRAGRTIAALNISTNAARISMTELRRSIIPPLVETAREISRQVASQQ